MTPKLILKAIPFLLPVFLLLSCNQPPEEKKKTTAYVFREDGSIDSCDDWQQEKIKYHPEKGTPAEAVEFTFNKACGNEQITMNFDPRFRADMAVGLLKRLPGEEQSGIFVDENHDSLPVNCYFMPITYTAGLKVEISPDHKFIVFNRWTIKNKIWKDNTTFDPGIELGKWTR